MQTADPQQIPIDPRIRQRRFEVQRQVGRRRLRLAVASAALVTLAAGGLAVAHTSLFGAHRLRVLGVAAAERRTVLEAARLSIGEPLIDIVPGASQRGIERLAWVAAASVVRQWPSGVTVTVTARRPVAEIRAATGAALVDSTGRVVADVARPRRELPVLTGIGGAPMVGSWVRGSAGWRAPLGSRASLPVSPGAAARTAGTPAEAVLATASGLAAAGVAAASITFGAGGLLRADIRGTDVVLGPATDLAAKLASLRLLARAGALRGARSVDLEVPSRPAVTPRPAVAAGPG